MNTLDQLAAEWERDKNATNCALIGHPTYGIDAERKSALALMSALKAESADWKSKAIKLEQEVADEHVAHEKCFVSAFKIVNCEECGGTGVNGYHFVGDIEGGKAIPTICHTCRELRAQFISWRTK